MTDYFYQSRARRRPPEDDDRQQPVDRHGDAYAPEDAAAGAEYGPDYGYDADLPAETEPLWYEDRAGHAEAAEDDGAEDYGPEDDDLEGVADAGLPASADQGGWDEDDAYDGTAPASGRVYVAGGQAAAARAAAASGERNIRFDPTKERGAVYYDKAERHSRHVRWLKIGLPAVALLAVAGFFVVMTANRGGDGLPALTLSGINLDTREITMDKPHISGFDGTKRSYEVNAETAVQALGNPKIVNLETIDARFAVADDVRAHLLSRSGVYDADTQKLTLDGGIDVTTTNGYSGRLEHADVDIENGTVFSDTGVLLRGKEGQITADSMEVLDRGKRIFFRGNVKLHFTPPEEETATDQAGTGSGATPEAASAPTTETDTPAPDGAT
jgi:lipopolysaccharide export system protein LptC